MSTKIHNGYRLPTADLFALSERFQRLRTEGERLVRKDLARIIAVAMTDLIDGPVFGNGEITQRPFSDAMIAVCHKIGDANKSSYRNTTYDFKLSFAVLVDHNDRSAYATVYTEKPYLRKLWVRIFEAMPFFYWDNTDRPSSISNTEWQRRGDLWGRLVPDCPANNGPSFELFEEPNWLLDPQIVRRYLPSWEERVRFKAVSLANNHYGRQITPTGPDGSKYWQVIDWMRSPAGKAAAEALKPWVAATLDRDAPTRALDEVARARRRRSRQR